MTPSGSGGGDGGAEVAAEQFRLLVDRVTDYAIFLLDPDGRVASWNAGADRSRVTVALAGQPPPLLARDGKVEAVAVPGGPALGIYDGGYQWESGVLEVGDTWTLLCYTDGLVEGLREPGSLERFGIEALSGTAAALIAARVGLDELVDGLLDVVHTANGGDLSDDVAILCVGRCQRTAGHLGPAAQAEMPTGRRG